MRRGTGLDWKQSLNYGGAKGLEVCGGVENGAATEKIASDTSGRGALRKDPDEAL